MRVHHTVIPARMLSMENDTRISLFVSELYLRNRVSDHHVSASSRPTDLWLSRVHDPVAKSTSKCFGFSLWHKKFDNFSLVVFTWHLTAYSMTSQYSVSQ